MKILNLTLTAKWFEMIRSGEKKEEYREIKYYWFDRLFVNKSPSFDLWSEPGSREQCCDCMRALGSTHDFSSYQELIDFFSIKERHFDIVRFTNGYSRHRPTINVECLGISIGQGKLEWGATGQSFIISLGKIISQENIK